MVTPPLLLLPWTVQLASQPALLFLEAGQQVPGLATAGLPARSLLLLSPGGPGLPPFWVTGGLALAALGALLLTARRSLVLAGWAVALLGLLIAAAASRVLITPDGAFRPVAAWPGIALAVAAAGLVLAVVVAADVLPGQLAEGRWRRPAGLGVLVLVLAAASAPLLAAGEWLSTGVRGPVTASSGPVLPAFVSVSADTGQRLRTLVLRQGADGVTFEVLRDSDPLIGATELSQPPSGERALDGAVSTLVAPSGGDAQDQGKALAALGIGYVLLPEPVNGTLAGTLNDVAALRPVSKTGAFQLWRVADTTAQARVIEPDGTVVPVPSGQVGVSGAAAPRSGGTLVLAEPSGGWSATLNGAALQSLPPVDGWAQAFRLPPGGGTLDVSHSQLGRDLIIALEALAVLVVAVLALPGTRVPAESGAAAAAPAEPAGRRERGRDHREGGRERREGGHERREGGRGRVADAPVPAMAAEPATAAHAAGPGGRPRCWPAPRRPRLRPGPGRLARPGRLAAGRPARPWPAPACSAGVPRGGRWRPGGVPVPRPGPRPRLTRAARIRPGRTRPGLTRPGRTRRREPGDGRSKRRRFRRGGKTRRGQPAGPGGERETRPVRPRHRPAGAQAARARRPVPCPRLPGSAGAGNTRRRQAGVTRTSRVAGTRRSRAGGTRTTPVAATRPGVTPTSRVVGTRPGQAGGTRTTPVAGTRRGRAVGTRMSPVVGTRRGRAVTTPMSPVVGTRRGRAVTTPMSPVVGTRRGRAWLPR